MTSLQEEYLAQLEGYIDRLEGLVLRQKKQIEELEHATTFLEGARQQLQQENAALKSRNKSLLMSRMIVAADEDWHSARRQLESLHKKIINSIKLLESE